MNANSEGHGYFLQPAGLKYQFDLSKPVGERIGSILIRNPAGEYVPINPTQEYSIASRRFIFDKWSRLGAFGDRTIERSAVGKSPVEMVGEFIQGRTIDPSSFQPEGRITDLTPKAAELPLKVGPTILAPALSEAARTHDQGNK